MNIRSYGYTPENVAVYEYTLTNKNGIELRAINYGCVITSLSVPDKDGSFENVILGFDALEGYISSPHYHGAVIGRYANRISKGKFKLDDKEYILAQNLFPHHLHGGIKGFDKKIWTASCIENENGEGIEFYYESADGEEGYPGTVKLSVRYFLTNTNEVVIEYSGSTDKKTILNVTQHAYFNLNPKNENALDHQLMIHADYFLPLDDTLIPTGEIRSVDNTPFDFNTSKHIGRDIEMNNDQLRMAHGYDHNWILTHRDEMQIPCAILSHRLSGRVLTLFTSEPGIQLYTGNFLDDPGGRNGKAYGPHAGVCLETQHYPDSPNHPLFPDVELSPGELFQSKTVWRFSVMSDE